MKGGGLFHVKHRQLSGGGDIGGARGSLRGRRQRIELAGAASHEGWNVSRETIG